MLGFSCILLVGILLLIPKSRTRILILCSAITLGVGFYVAVVATGEAHLGLSDLSSGASRIFLWGVAWQLFAGSPIHGVGWGNFQVLYGTYIDPSLVAANQYGVHNTYLALLAETGVLGFFAFIVLLFVGFRESYRHFRTAQDAFARSLGFGVIGALVALLVQGFVEFQIAFTQFGVLFWMLLALLVISGRLQHESVAEEVGPTGVRPENTGLVRRTMAVGVRMPRSLNLAGATTNLEQPGSASPGLFPRQSQS
jgi:O-antigen ligase